MSKKEISKPFKVLKNKVENDEHKAMLHACEKLDTFSRNLKPKHTEKTFVFEKIR